MKAYVVTENSHSEGWTHVTGVYLSWYTAEEKRRSRQNFHTRMAYPSTPPVSVRIQEFDLEDTP